MNKCPNFDCTAVPTSCTGVPAPPSPSVTVVPDNTGSFLMVGGTSDKGSTYLDTIYRFDEDTYEFVLLDQRLPYGASRITAIFVAPEMVTLLE